MTDKVVVDGNVAVLYSPGFGAGWSTWSMGQKALFCPELVNAILRNASFEELSEIATRLFPEDYQGGLSQLTIAWLPQGTLFRVHEYDGSESIEVREEMDWVTA